MVNPFICGSGSFNRQIEDDDEICSPSSAPRNKPRKSSSSRRKDSKNNNPYADRGLDKFSALLAELEEKKQKIYTQKGAEEISFVHFVYTNSNDWKPIVVRTREKEPQKKSFKDMDKHPIEANEAVQESRNQFGNNQETKKEKEKKNKKKKIMDMWRRPAYYLPVIVILILVFLAVSGRSFAILCTSIGWYLVPTIKGGRSNVKRQRKKKENGRRDVSEKKKNVVNDHGFMSSPTSVIGGMNEFSPRGRSGHRKSW